MTICCHLARPDVVIPPESHGKVFCVLFPHSMIYHSLNWGGSLYFGTPVLSVVCHVPLRQTEDADAADME